MHPLYFTKLSRKSQDFYFLVGIHLKTSLKFVPYSPVSNILALVQIMAWCQPGDKPLSEQMMVSLLMHICVIRPQWVKNASTWTTRTCLSYNTMAADGLVNSLWPSDVIWQQGSRSTLAQVMACCLPAPSHYLNQCWVLISEVLWHSPDSNFTENT